LFTGFFQLELKYANQTDALEPPHRYVPWVVVDGQPLLEASSFLSPELQRRRLCPTVWSKFIPPLVLVVTMNMFSSIQDYENFEAYICKAYKGTPPKACQGLGRLQMALETAAEARNGVSYNSGVSKLATAEDEGGEHKVGEY
jgi:interferon, gamma-inducible protein 30